VRMYSSGVAILEVVGVVHVVWCVKGEVWSHENLYRGGNRSCEVY
jgi:hypothetical protein